MTKVLEFELQKAADRLIKEILKVKIGETVVITADTSSDERVVNATASSVHSIGGKPMVIWTSTPGGVGKAADDGLPVEALGGALEKTDVWIEFNKQWLLYSTPFEIAYENNKSLRYICLVEMNPDMMIRNIGEVEMELLSEFMHYFTDMNKKASTMRVTTPAGTDLSFELTSKHLVSCDAGDASTPGIYMMPGQINVVPKFDTVNGTLVFDGTLVPPVGKLEKPIRLTVENSAIKKIEGGYQAREFEEWLKSFKDPNMFKLAHIAYGVNPGSKLTGNIVEDERVWGATEWGIGYVSPYDAPPKGQDAKSHCDGICLNSTVWLDDVKVMEEGTFVEETLKKYEDKIFKRS
jgi:leucyl aminopeptidase (aminopeptidase T)